MDRKELKQTLHEQFVPMNEAVKRKLAYLNGDDVFAADGDTADEDFTELLRDDNMSFQSQQKIAEPMTTTNKITVHKQSLAEKIAALRGISSAVPSEYINRRF